MVLLIDAKEQGKKALRQAQYDRLEQKKKRDLSTIGRDDMNGAKRRDKKEK